MRPLACLLAFLAAVPLGAEPRPARVIVFVAIDERNLVPVACVRPGQPLRPGPRCHAWVPRRFAPRTRVAECPPHAESPIRRAYAARATPGEARVWPAGIDLGIQTPGEGARVVDLDLDGDGGIDQFVMTRRGRGELSFRSFLRRDGRELEIASGTEGAAPVLLVWSGDLDGDGKRELLVKETDQYRLLDSEGRLLFDVFGCIFV